MRNLQLVYLVKKQFQGGITPKLLIHSYSYNGENLYLYSGSHILSLNLETNVLEELLEEPNVIGCEYLTLNDEICVATGYGEVLLLNPTTKNHKTVTYCGGGIEKMSWSPDQEVIVFITKEKQVVVMTSSYEPISESFLDDTNFGDREFIRVGWGKKETQFHGSEGKQAAKQTVDFVPPDNYHDLDPTINVTWRGDGELFAVSYVGVNGRMFKVFNKEGTLQYTSERLNGLGTCIAWKPSGSVIAVPHKLPNKCTIALFEKNGLRHREIVLPFNFKDEPVLNLVWSSDSDILSIETTIRGRSQLYVYTVCNYHWYLKQFLKFDCKILQFSWSHEVNEDKTLHVLLQTGIYLVYRWCYCTNYSDNETLHNQAVVSVIDGRNLLLTDFRNNVIPPPMFSRNMENSSYINACGFLKFSGDREYAHKFFILDDEGFIKLFELEFELLRFGKKLKSVNLLSSLKPDENVKLSSIPLNMNQLIWLNDDSIVFHESYDQDNNSSRIGLIKLRNETYQKISSIDIPEVVGSISDVERDIILIHSINGKVFSVEIKSDELNYPKLVAVLPEFCEYIKAVKNQNEIKFIAHKHNQNLYMNNSKISSDVTSFHITEKYVIFTQLSSLKFFRISNSTIVYEREMERGGRIVTIIPFDSRTVLQMPRGNLEAISPRILLLDTVGRLLDQLRFGQAMEILIKHRINLNFLFDHNPKSFVENLDRFLNEIQCNCQYEWLNLFLSNLYNIDFTKTFYANNYDINITNYPNGYDVSKKIDFVSKLLCERMIEKDFKHFMLPIITSYFKTKNLEKALEIIWNEKKMETNQLVNGSDDEQRTKTKSEEALKYLLHLVDVNDLFNVALGMYDFDLVLFVANKSQKDPKEYILFLNELKRLEENYRKFKIDEHLKKYEKALESLAKCNEERFEECLEFVEKHKLYQKALIEFRDNEKLYKKIALCFADHLRACSKHEDASLLYERGGDLQQAILSAKHCLDWQRCIMLTKILKSDDPGQLRSISLSLIPSLQEHGKYEDAFYLLNTFVSDFKKALDSLLSGRLYLRAIFEAKVHETDLIDSIIRPHLLEYKLTLKENITSDEELFLNYKNRLLKVRLEKSKKNSNQVNEDGVDECDLLSDTTSMNSTRFSGSSKGTGKTFRSSKNRRKHERKLLSLKEGNPYEDIALIDALYNHIMKVINQQQHIRDTCKAIIQISISDDHHAKEIQKSFSNLLKIITNSLDEIWIPEMITSQQLMGANIDYTQIQNEQRYAMIKPQKRFKPQLDIIDWKHEILE